MGCGLNSPNEEFYKRAFAETCDLPQTAWERTNQRRRRHDEKLYGKFACLFRRRKRAFGHAMGVVGLLLVTETSEDINVLLPPEAGAQMSDALADGIVALAGGGRLHS